MKAENSTEITRKYWAFAAWFVLLLSFTLVCLLLLHKTKRQQQRRISEEEEAYNRIQAQQFRLSGKVDSLITDMRLMATPEGATNPYLRSVVNNRRLDIERTLRTVDSAEFLIYHRLAHLVRPALLVKDSIGTLRNQALFLREALDACIQSVGQVRQPPRISRNSSRFR